MSGFGKKYCEFARCKDEEGKAITLIEGEFEYDNGLYTETQTAPSVYNGRANGFEIKKQFVKDANEKIFRTMRKNLL